MPSCVIQFPADSKWNPAIPQLPHRLLDSTDYRPDEPERDRWAPLIRLLPEARRATIDKCGRFAVHVAKETSAGRLESLNPCSCGDKTACGYCATRYAVEAAADRLAKLLAVCKAARCALAVIEARAVVPEWQACARAVGCDKAEARGRLCTASDGCGPCGTARFEHSRAIEVETDARAALLDAFKVATAGMGGVYTTRLELGRDGIEIVFTLLAPAAVFHVERGTARSLPMFGDAAVPQLTNLDAWKRAGGGPVATRVARTDDRIALEVFASHLPTLEPLMRRADTLTETELRTLVRADGLTATTRGGKARRVQRTAWFGVFAGRNQGPVLRLLGIPRIEKDPHCRQIILDHYKILEKTPERVVGQSTSTAMRREFPRSTWKSDAYVGKNGAPLVAPESRVVWGRTAGWIENVKHWKSVVSGGAAGLSRDWTTRDSHQSALRKEWGTLVESILGPTPKQSSYEGNHASAARVLAKLRGAP